MADSELLKKRLLELAKKSAGAEYFVFTDFLGLAERNVFASLKSSLLGISYREFGGTADAERIIVKFGNPDELGYDVDFPIVIIKAAPKSPKFADKLTHRDFLGALLNLGIERDKLGDIIIHDNIGYIFAREELGEYICTSLLRVKHTDVFLQCVDSLPEEAKYKRQSIRVQAASERADAIIAKVFSLSRDDSLMLFRRGLVFIDGVCSESPARPLKVGERVSVRGYGRFSYLGYESLTKKGRLNINIELFV